MKMSKNTRVEQLRDYFKGHNKCKEQKAHTSKVIFRLIECKTNYLFGYF